MSKVSREHQGTGDSQITHYFSDDIEKIITDGGYTTEYEIALRGLIARAQDLGFRIDRDDGLGHRFNVIPH